MKTSRREGERGFTLLETLIAMAILGIIITVLYNSVIQGILTTSSTTALVGRTNVVAIASRYFAPDVQSSPTVPKAPGVPSCGGGTAAVEMGATTAPYQITYLVRAAGSDTALYRRVCNGAIQMSQIELGRTPNSVKSSFTASGGCSNPTAACRSLTLTLHWSGPDYTVSLQANRRVT